MEAVNTPLSWIISKLTTMPQQSFETRSIFRCGDNQYFPDPRQHEHAQRIINHRLVIHRQELFACHLRQRIEAGARASCKNDSFHCFCSSAFAVSSFVVLFLRRSSPCSRKSCSALLSITVSFRLVIRDRILLSVFFSVFIATSLTSHTQNLFYMLCIFSFLRCCCFPRCYQTVGVVSHRIVYLHKRTIWQHPDSLIPGLFF